MKLIFSIFIGSTVMFSAQKTNAQTAARTLDSIYPNAKKIEWKGADRNGNNEVHFEMNGSHYRSDFTPSGHWIETERSIKWDDLTPAVKHTIKKHAEKDDIVELEEVHNHIKGWFYDVEIHKKKKGKRDLVIAIDGNIIDKEPWK